MSPTHVGAYPIERTLGHGGAGAVYLGRHPHSGTPVAIKTLLAGRQASPRLLQRFELEAQALTRLRHPSLVPLLDAGIDRGIPFLVLEYVPGDTLEARVERDGSLEPEEAAQIVRTLASAVHYAHLCQVVHRDLKPANVLLRASGEAVLTDFGLALHLDAEGRLSTSGVCLGTPGFWSPEQARGDLEAIGPASDVYGLGALLFYCLTGEPPVRTDSLQANLDQTIRGARRPPSSVNTRIDPDLDAICARCLELDPADRYPTAEAVAGALGVYLEDRPAARGGLLVPALALLALSLIGVLVVALVTRDAPAPEAAATSAATTAPLPTPETAPATAPPPSPSPSPSSPRPTPTATTPPRREDPAQAQRLVQEALRLMRAHAFAKAAAKLVQAEGLAPSHPQRVRWVGMRGYCYREAKAFRDALHDLSIYIEARPSEARPYVDRGMAHFGLRQFQKCIDDMTQALKLAPKTAMARYWRAAARVQLGTGETDLVVRDLKRFLAEQRPPHPDLAPARKLLQALERKPN